MNPNFCFVGVNFESLFTNLPVKLNEDRDGTATHILKALLWKISSKLAFGDDFYTSTENPFQISVSLNQTK